MSEVETFHDVVEEEIHFKEDVPIVESSTPPTPITSSDMDVIIEGWETKFKQISRCLREVQLASEKASSEMFSMTRDGRAREKHQERRIEAMHVGITEFLERCDPAHLAALLPLDAPTASTPYTPVHADRGTVQTTSGFRLPTISCQPGQVDWTCAQHGIRASEIATTLGKRAPGITTTLGTRTPGITTTLETRASESTTTLGTRASEFTTTLEICATTTFTTLEIGAGITDPTNGLHMRMIEEIAVTCSETHTIVGWTHQCRARPRAPKSRRLMGLYQRNSAHGLSSLRPSRAANVEH